MKSDYSPQEVSTAERAVKSKLAAILREDAGAIGLFQYKDGAMVEAVDADQTLGGLGLAGTPQSPAHLVAAVAGEAPKVTLYAPCTMHHAPGDALLRAARPGRGDEAPAGGAGRRSRGDRRLNRPAGILSNQHRDIINAIGNIAVSPPLAAIL